MTDRTSEALTARMNSMIHRLNVCRAADVDELGHLSPDTLAYESTVQGFSDVLRGLEHGANVDKIRESLHALEQAAENAALLVRPSWAYIRGASAAAILAQKMERTGA